jgi:hypothetical protein
MEPQVNALNLEIDKEGERQFLAYKNDHPDDQDLQIVKVMENFKVSKTLPLSKLAGEADLDVELTIFEFKDDEKSRLLKPCYCLVTRQTEVTIQFLINDPTVAKLKSCYLAGVKGYDPGQVKFNEKDQGTDINEFEVTVDKKPLFKTGSDGELHWPCRFTKKVEDNDDFVLMRVDLKQTKTNVCLMTITYALWHTQIVKYGADNSNKCTSTLAKINFIPDDLDEVTVTLKTPKFYQSYEYYSNKLQLLSASYGEK